MNDPSPPAPDLRALDAYLTGTNLERLLQVNERTLRRWIRDGIFPAPVRIGGVRRWRQDDVRSFLDGASKSYPRHLGAGATREGQ